MKKINKSFATTIILSLFMATNIFAQKEAANWHFGNNAGIAFPFIGSNTPVAITTTSTINTYEGCASISDGATGNLLFYTDGITVWNQINGVMTNGTGLKGDPSSTQSSVIVPMPGNAKQYYIFTTPAVGRSDGLRYSLVDMSLGAYGEVVSGTKNIQLDSFMYEKIAVACKDSGTGYWVVAHKDASQKFLVYNINSTTAPSATANLATYSVGPATANFQNYYGYLKFSPDGKKLAHAVWGINTVEVYNFNPSTGVISASPLTLTEGTPKNLSHPYGVEFSPSGRYLYTTGRTVTPDSCYLSQFDLVTWTPAAVLASKVTISSYKPAAGSYQGFSALQLGPDSRIYVTRASYTDLSWIKNPDLPAVSTIANGSNYAAGAIDLGGKTCYHGLPNFVGCFTGKPVAVSDMCCDSMYVRPYDFQTNHILGKTFTFVNRKPSPISRIEFRFSPGITLGDYRGSDLYIDNSTWITGRWNTNYYYINGIPNFPLSSNLCSYAPNRVEFNMGIDYTTNFPNGWTGNVTFTVKHCNGDSCVFTTGQWAAVQPLVLGGIMLERRIADSLLAVQLKMIGNTKITSPIKFVGIRLNDTDYNVFAVSGSRIAGKNTANEPLHSVTYSGMGDHTAMYEWNVPVTLKSGDSSDALNLVLSKPKNKSGWPLIYCTFYDEDGNEVARDSITVKGQITGMRQDAFFNDFNLLNAYPNPSNGDVTVKYMVSKSSNVTLTIYDLSGNEIKTVQEGFVSQGYYTVPFNLSGIAAGSYIIKMTSGNQVSSLPLIIAK